MENSPQMKNVELTYLNSLLTQQQNDLDDEVQVTLSTGTWSFAFEEESIGSGGSQLSSVMSGLNSPSVTVQIPNGENETSITAATGLRFNYGEHKSYVVSPSLSASHTFDLTGYDSELAVSLSNARASILSEYTYQNEVLKFENQVLTSIKTILQAEQNLDEDRYDLEKAEKSLADALELGNITQGSVSYLQAMNSIELQKRTIDATEKQIETAKQHYTTLTGLVWDGVENLPTPDLTLNVLSSGDTDVVLAGIDVEIAQQAIEELNHKIGTSELSIDGAIGGDFSKDSTSYDGSAGVAYSAGNWAVGTAFGGSFDNQSGKFHPTLSVGAKWSNKTTKRSDEIELQMLNNNLVSAQNELADARSTYIQDAQNLQIEILNHEYTLQNNAAQKEYLESNLEYQQTLFDSGLCTQQDVDDARKQVEWASVQDMIDTIEGPDQDCTTESLVMTIRRNDHERRQEY